jgi:hypothetical protein
MGQETDDGIPYLNALKRSVGSEVAAAGSPARETNLEAQAGLREGAEKGMPQNSYQGDEKRRSPRYKCEGSVEMRELDCDVKTWASFTDVSLHGCYVEAQATYPVGTILYLKLEGNGMKVEAKGNVRVNYPYFGMGIAFVELTAENEARLRELLGSISRPSVIMGPGIASSLPARGPIGVVPLISDAQAAIQALIAFFESRQMLMREDFLRILHQSQAAEK